MNAFVLGFIRGLTGETRKPPRRAPRRARRLYLVPAPPPAPLDPEEEEQALLRAYRRVAEVRFTAAGGWEWRP